ncbi:hypothetical protein FOCC_FOCC014366 [Frankliniella occidentalis]|nr:hypothetical protein FOCC_FOCC014366 [Frankliniella occidentalis]
MSSLNLNFNSTYNGVIAKDVSKYKNTPLLFLYDAKKISYYCESPKTVLTLRMAQNEAFCTSNRAQGQLAITSGRMIVNGSAEVDEREFRNKGTMAMKLEIDKKQYLVDEPF